jgi:hypothetical protein
MPVGPLRRLYCFVSVKTENQLCFLDNVGKKKASVVRDRDQVVRPSGPGQCHNQWARVEIHWPRQGLRVTVFIFRRGRLSFSARRGGRP